MTKREELVDILGSIGLKDLSRGEEELACAKELFTMLIKNDENHIGEPKKRRKRKAKSLDDKLESAHKKAMKEPKESELSPKKQLEIKE